MLFRSIGGNGNISWYCVKKAISEGHDVWALNRNQTSKTRRTFPDEAKRIIVDITDIENVKKALTGFHFDCVCDFICYDEKRAAAAVDIFKGIADQYIFISSEAVYKRYEGCLPFTERSVRYSPDEVQGYIHGKICAENIFIEAFEKKGFPVTIVRPGYTYDTIMPVSLGYNCFTVAENIISNHILYVMGNGENYWSPLHSSDFAEAFIYLIGNKNAVGKAFQITGTELITLNQMANYMIDAIGVPNIKIQHLSLKELILTKIIKDQGIAMQYTQDFLYDNTAIKTITKGWNQTVLFSFGIKQTVDWFMADKQRQRISLELKYKIELLNKKYKN